MKLKRGREKIRSNMSHNRFICPYLFSNECLFLVCFRFCSGRLFSLLFSPSVHSCILNSSSIDTHRLRQNVYCILCALPSPSRYSFSSFLFFSFHRYTTFEHRLTASIIFVRAFYYFMFFFRSWFRVCRWSVCGISTSSKTHQAKRLRNQQVWRWWYGE